MRRSVFCPVRGVLPALIVAIGLSASAGLAEPCPEPPDHSSDLAVLIGQIQAADNEDSAREISNQMWEFWADAPNDQAQSLLDRGMSRRAAYDYLGALADFDRLTDYCPNYAEGFNQRAFVNFLRQDYKTALVDLDRALALSPDHIAAMSGRALSLFALQRMDEARDALEQALALNPWLPERSLAAPGGPLQPLEPAGEDL
jgi:tetratricopeptide (TPR) repeat protein